MRKQTLNKPGAGEILRIGKSESRESQGTENADARGWILMETRRKARTLLICRRTLPIFFLSLLLAAAILARGQELHAQNKAPAQTKAAAAAQETFATPEEAMQALVTAVTSQDRAALPKIFGAEYDQLLSGDPVEDDKDLAEFRAAIQESARLQKKDDNTSTFIVGKDNWPTPIPIAKRENVWLFDTKAGLEEILNRRIGENELSAITTCRAYVVAQWEYFTEGDHDNDAVAEYARKFISSPGQRDGLYWETSEGEKPSPLGGLVAEARAEGYGPKSRSEKEAPGGNVAQEEPPATVSGAKKDSGQPRHPFHGYYFRILTRQGPHAPGGKYNYIINGNMIGGYALVAFPAKWGNSGVMTFLVNQQGRVYEKNLGADTEKIARGIAEYDPDPSWKRVDF
jgi:hypothetical protein